MTTTAEQRSGSRVLVGTYRPENEAWIRDRRLYALYELCEESSPAKLLGCKTVEVFVA